jgi:hypothetical protein
MSKLLTYLNLIDGNSEMREAHLVNPGQAMTQYGLGKAEQQALASGDMNMVAEFTGADADEKRIIVYITASGGQNSAFAGRAYQRASA